MIYLDYASTTPIDKNILDAYSELLNTYFANSSSSHALGVQVETLQNRAREQIGSYFSVSSKEVIFTSGASEANNLAIKGVALKYQNRGKHIITTSFEHKSVLECVKQLHDLFNYEVTYLEPNVDGLISLSSLKKAIREDTILVSIMAVNNEIGSINNINELAEYTKKHSKAFFHTDASQAIGKVDINYSNVDLITISAHKMYGLKGSGVLIKKENVSLTPLILGGGQEFGYRSGTSNWPVNVMMAKTLRLALESQKENYDKVSIYHNMIMEALKKYDDVLINSPVLSSPYIINFSIKNKLASTIAQAFETKGIYVSTISACATHSAAPSYVINSVYHDTDRASSSVRISLSKYTSMDDISSFIKALDEVIKSLRSVK